MRIIQRKRFNLKWFWLFEGEDGGGVSTGSEGTSVTVDVGAPATVSGEVPSSPVAASSVTSGVDWGSIAPADIKDKPYFQNILKSSDPTAELLKQFDGLQTKLGQRPAGVPEATASEEDWNKFYETLRPKSVDDYELKPLDLGEDKKEITEFMNANRDEAFLKNVKTIMHEEGLTKRQAERLADKYEKLSVGAYEKVLADSKAAKDASEKDFSAMGKELFGDDLDKALDYGKNFIKKALPENIQKRLGELPNEALLAMAAMGQYVNKTYEKEDTFTPTSGTQTQATASELRSEMRTLMSNEAYRNKFHPEHTGVFSRIQEISNRIAKLENAK